MFLCVLCEVLCVHCGFFYHNEHKDQHRVLKVVLIFMKNLRHEPRRGEIPADGNNKFRNEN